VPLCEPSTVRKPSAVRELSVVRKPGINCEPIAMCVVCGPTVALCAIDSRPLFATIAQAASYNQWVSWVPFHSAFLDLAAELPRLDGAPTFRDDDEHIAASTHSASDASANGLAVCRILCRAGREHVWHEGLCGVPWFREPITGLTARLSSTLRELLAVLRFFCHHGADLTGRRVASWTDSNNTGGSSCVVPPSQISSASPWPFTTWLVISA